MISLFSGSSTPPIQCGSPHNLTFNHTWIDFNASSVQNVLRDPIRYVLSQNIKMETVDVQQGPKNCSKLQMAPAMSCEPSPLPLATVSNEKAGINSNRENGRAKFIATNILSETCVPPQFQQFEPHLTFVGCVN